MTGLTEISLALRYASRQYRLVDLLYSKLRMQLRLGLLRQCKARWSGLSASPGRKSI